MKENHEPDYSEFAQERILGRNLKQQIISTILQPSESFKKLQTNYLKNKTEEDMKKRFAKME